MFLISYYKPEFVTIHRILHSHPPLTAEKKQKPLLSKVKQRENTAIVNVVVFSLGQQNTDGYLSWQKSSSHDIQGIARAEMKSKLVSQAPKLNICYVRFKTFEPVAAIESSIIRFTVRFNIGCWFKFTLGSTLIRRWLV